MQNSTVMAFAKKTVSELQKYLKDRGVSTAHYNKVSLVGLCQEAFILNIDIDPDGLLEDRQHIISSKLTLPDGYTILPNPALLEKTNDITPLPTVTIIDIYNYLMQSQFNTHENLKDHRKMEGYTMAMDNHVEVLSACKLASHDNYFVLAGQVKPRTRDVDPVTKLKYYDTWIILMSTANRSTVIYSAHCVCKGGIDGYCRHVVAVLFQLIQYVDDHSKKSVTSGPCLWVRRAKRSHEPVMATKIKTKITNGEFLSNEQSDSDDEYFNPLPEGQPLPDPAKLVEMTKETLPDACMLDAYEIRPERPKNDYSPPNVMTPIEKLTIFFHCHDCTPSKICDSDCFEELLVDMYYNDDEVTLIESGTRDQHLNPHWHAFRKGLLTASNFKTIIHTTNMTKCALSLLHGSSIDEDDLPWNIEYGRTHESKARDLFLKAHKFKHRKCSMKVPGLCVNPNMAILGASPDGILTCDQCNEPQTLLEIKCLGSKRNYTPKIGLVQLGICTKDADGNLKMSESHKYYYQIQGQMGVTNIKKCWFVAYTNKGICSMLVDFNFDRWLQMLQKLYNFYQYGYMPVIKGPFTC